MIIKSPYLSRKLLMGCQNAQPICSSHYINTVVINPYWYVPETIKVKNIIPAAKANPNFLKNSRIDVINSWTDRSVVPPESIDWATVDPQTFTHEFRQDTRS